MSKRQGKTGRQKEPTVCGTDQKAKPCKKEKLVAASGSTKEIQTGDEKEDAKVGGSGQSKASSKRLQIIGKGGAP